LPTADRTFNVLITIRALAPRHSRLWVREPFGCGLAPHRG
jgi:hypothetical protein